MYVVISSNENVYEKIINIKGNGVNCYLFNHKFFWIFIKSISSIFTGFYPSAEKPKGYCYEQCVSPSVRRHFTLLAVHGAFLQLSPFLVCRFVITLFIGSFKDFEKIPFLGSKTAKLGTENIHFQQKSVFRSAGCVSSPSITIFGLQVCYNFVLWRL